jgi:hypothetical protein
MRFNNIYTPQQVARLRSEVKTEIGGQWMEARPEGFASIRNHLRAAWLVLTGKADAVVWPGGQ